MIKDRKTGYIFTTTDYSVKEVLNGKDVLTLYVKEGSEDAKRIVNEMVLVEEAYSKAEFVVKMVKTSTDGLLEVEADLNTDYFRESIFVGFSKTGSPFNILNSVVPDGWTVEDHTGISESKTVELDGPTALGVADSVYSIFNVGIRYDFERKQQHLYNLDAFKADGQYMTKELNLVSIDRYSESKDLINRLYARGKDGLTFADINNGKDYVEDTSYLSGKIVSDFIKDDRFESKESLLAYAQETLKSRSKPTSSYECKPIDIGAENAKYAFLKLALMDVVTLLDVDNDMRADHQVVEKIVYPYDTTQNELTLSTKIPTLTDDTSYVADQISNPNSDFNQKLQNDMDRIANAVLQASGGHIIINFGDDGKMAEILVMDTNDKKTAKDVMRINMGGIAFSTSGYNGPFNGAWSLNGEFFTDFIATWKLSAALIVAGILQSLDGKTFYLDLEKGILKMEADELKIAGKTVAEIAAENGGAERNLLLYSNFVKTKDPFGFGSLQDGVWTYSNIPKDRWTSITLLGSEAVKSMRGQKLTFSVKVNTTGIATDGGQYGYALVNLYAYVKYAGSDSQIRSHIINIDNGETYPSTNGFKLLQATMQLQDKEITEVGMGLIWQRSSGNISVKEPMLNFGEVAAAYAPAPEDGVNPDANLSQSDVFNTLTNNGQLKGLFMKDGKLYINSNYISTGIIRSSNGQIQFNLDTGVISCANGSSEVRIREGYFELYYGGVRKVSIGTNHNVYGPQIMLADSSGGFAYMSSQETDVNGKLYAKSFTLAAKDAKWEWDGNKGKYVLVAE